MVRNGFKVPALFARPRRYTRPSSGAQAMVKCAFLFVVVAGNEKWNEAFWDSLK